MTGKKSKDQGSQYVYDVANFLLRHGIPEDWIKFYHREDGMPIKYENWAEFGNSHPFDIEVEKLDLRIEVKGAQVIHQCKIKDNEGNITGYREQEGTFGVRNAHTPKRINLYAFVFNQDKFSTNYVVFLTKKQYVEIVGRNWAYSPHRTKDKRIDLIEVWDQAYADN